MTATLTPAIVVHLASAVPALGLGAWLLSRPKGTPPHRAFGKIWVGLMVVVAISSFWVQELKAGGGYSAIHLLSVWTLFSLTMAVVAIRRRKVERHRRWMIGTFVGLLIAGALTVLPGRFMSTLL